jgi:hypothetical protein
MPRRNLQTRVTFEIIFLGYNHDNHKFNHDNHGQNHVHDIVLVPFAFSQALNVHLRA